MATAKKSAKRKPKKKASSASSIKPLMDEVKSLQSRVAHVEAFLSKIQS